MLITAEVRHPCSAGIPVKSSDAKFEVFFSVECIKPWYLADEKMLMVTFAVSLFSKLALI